MIGAGCSVVNIGDLVRAGTGQQRINWSGRQLKVVKIRHYCRLTFPRSTHVSARIKYKVLIGTNIK